MRRSATTRNRKIIGTTAWQCPGCGLQRVRVGPIRGDGFAAGRALYRWCSGPDGCGRGDVVLAPANARQDDYMDYSKGIWDDVRNGEISDKLSDDDVEALYHHARRSGSIYGAGAAELARMYGERVAEARRRRS